MNIPENVKDIIEQLNKHGFEAYAVGGCVRDTLMGREPMDWDLTTSAKPEQVKALFRRTIDTGIEHGTVTVMIGKQGYEVTTYRVDGEYEDHRHPKQVKFTASLHEDLKRRDFTINAMAYSMKTGIIDEFGGQEDIQNRIIRCVGDPVERFEEDALRMLRGIRFAGQLMFEIDDNTRKAMELKADTLTHVSSERIRVEMIKLITSPGPERLLDAAEVGLMKTFLPEWGTTINPLKTLECIQRINHQSLEQFGDKQRVMLSFIALLADTKSESGHILRRLTFDNETIFFVTHAITHANTDYGDFTRRTMRHVMNRVGVDVLPFVFEWQQASNPECTSDVLKAKHLFTSILDDKEAINLPDLKITGKEIIKLGVKPGPQVGEILQKLLTLVLDDPAMNEEVILQKFARKILTNN